MATGNWEEKSETVKFADFQFTLTRYFLPYDTQENREISPPEGRSKDGGSIENQPEAGNLGHSASESRIADLKDEEDEGNNYKFDTKTGIQNNGNPPWQKKKRKEKIQKLFCVCQKKRFLISLICKVISIVVKVESY